MVMIMMMMVMMMMMMMMMMINDGWKMMIDDVEDEGESVGVGEERGSQDRETHFVGA